MLWASFCSNLYQLHKWRKGKLRKHSTRALYTDLPIGPRAFQVLLGQFQHSVEPLPEREAALLQRVLKVKAGKHHSVWSLGRSGGWGRWSKRMIALDIFQTGVTPTKFMEIRETTAVARWTQSPAIPTRGLLANTLFPSLCREHTHTHTCKHTHPHANTQMHAHTHTHTLSLSVLVWEPVKQNNSWGIRQIANFPHVHAKHICWATATPVALPKV